VLNSLFIKKIFVLIKRRKKDDDKDTKVAKNSDDKASKAFHKVRKGDTLSSVAKRYGVSVKDLAAWNDLKAKSSLKAGLKLTILKADDEKENRRAKDDDEPKVAKKSKKDKDNNDDEDSKVAKKVKIKPKMTTMTNVLLKTKSA